MANLHLATTQLVRVDAEDVDLLQRHMPNVDEPEGALQLAASRVQAVHSIYTKNTDIINGAISAVGVLVNSDLNKKSTVDVLTVANKVTSALGLVKCVHPFITVAVVPFEIVIKLVIQKHENDKRTTGLIVQGLDLMVVLLQLNNVPADPQVSVPGHDGVQGRLQSVLENIRIAIHECGNAIDKYYRSRPIARYFKSSNWASRFQEIAKKFDTLKNDIIQALTIRTSIKTDQIYSILNKVYGLLSSNTEQEREFEMEVRHRGGREACLNRNSDIRDLDAKFKSTGILKNEKLRVVGTVKVGGVSRENSRKDSTLDPALLHDLRTPLPVLLEENKRIFETMLRAQTNEIKNAIQSTESRILHAFKSGAYSRVRDPHLKYIWRTMKWPLSIETPYFIAAVYDYFAERFAQTIAPHDDLGDIVFRSPSPATPANDPEEEHPPAVPLSDEWCLAYLDVYYIPALKEAFDDDANGLVNVREVNSFCDSQHLPSGWGILRRLAYAAAGWHTEMSLYCEKIRSLLNFVESIYDNILPGNRRVVCRYLNSNAITYVKLLTRGLSEPPAAIELIESAAMKMESHEQQLIEKLQQIGYEIHSAEFVPLWFGKGRIEQYLLPLIYVLIKRHVEITLVAQQTLIDKRELSTAARTLDYVLTRATDRISYLEESFHQQGIDPEAKFRTFARGLYAYLREPSNAPDDESWTEHRQLTDDFGMVLSGIDPSAVLRYEALNHIPLDSQVGSRVEFRKYIELKKLMLLDNMKLVDGPSYLTSEKAREFLHIQNPLSADVRLECYAIADLELRLSRKAVHEVWCNECKRSPLLGTIYDCLDCGNGDYQLCSDCISIPSRVYSDDRHTIKHNMIRHVTEISNHRALRMRRNILERLRYYLVWDPRKLDVCDRPTAVEHAVPGTLGDEDTTGHDGEVDDATIVQEDTSVTDGHPLKFAPLGPFDTGSVCNNCGSDLGTTFYCCAMCPNILSNCSLCMKCAHLGEFNNALKHFPDHVLVLIRDLPSATGAPSRDQEPQDTEDIVATEQLQEQVDVLQQRVVSLEENIGRILELVEIVAKQAQIPHV